MLAINIVPEKIGHSTEFGCRLENTVTQVARFHRKRLGRGRASLLHCTRRLSSVAGCSSSMQSTGRLPRMRLPRKNATHLEVQRLPRGLTSTSFLVRGQTVRSTSCSLVNTNLCEPILSREISSNPSERPDLVHPVTLSLFYRSSAPPLPIHQSLDHVIRQADPLGRPGNPSTSVSDLPNLPRRPVSQ